MGRLALRNLLTRPLRSLLALGGVSVSIIGVVGLLSFSQGIKAVLATAIDTVPGMIVLQKNSIDPIFSSISAEYLADLEAIPGVKGVMPELWRIEPSIEKKRVLNLGMPFTAPVLFGIDPARAEASPKMLIYGRMMRDGAWLKAGDTKVCCISPLIARHFGKTIGDTILVRETPFRIVGLYDTGQFILNVAIVMPIDDAREILGIAKEKQSSYYIESEDPSRFPAIKKEIESKWPGLDALTMAEMTGQFDSVMGFVDLLLLCISSVAVIVGGLGVINTMLMSVTERVGEFGILRANGWTRGNVMRLVLAESALLGSAAGLTGCLLGSVMVWGVASKIELQPVASPAILGGAFAAAVVLGIAGGAYPAWRAGRMNPIDAIRMG